MNINFLKKIVYNFYYMMFLFTDRKKNPVESNKIAEKFLKYNNNLVEKELENKKIKKILILLPHCIQKYLCPYKVTSNIENCHDCGQCVISDLLRLKKNYPVEIKVATGGTLARKHIKEIKPNLVIAVACKRDLMSGIHDAFPVKVIGVFNKILNEPCVNTTVSIDEIKSILEKFYKI